MTDLNRRLPPCKGRRGFVISPAVSTPYGLVCATSSGYFRTSFSQGAKSEVVARPASETPHSPRGNSRVRPPTYRAESYRFFPPSATPPLYPEIKIPADAITLGRANGVSRSTVARYVAGLMVELDIDPYEVALFWAEMRRGSVRATVGRWVTVVA